MIYPVDEDNGRTPKNPMAAMPGLENCRLSSLLKAPSRCEPGESGMGSVLATTSSVLFVNPTRTEMVFMRVSTRESVLIPKAVKFTVMSKSGVAKAEGWSIVARASSWAEG